MLVRFEIENHLSFRNRAALDLTAEALKDKKGHLHAPLLYNAKQLLLKAIVIYGKNSHGKTNFLKSYAYYRNLILGSFEYGKNESSITQEPFIFNTSTVNKPSVFESEFILKSTKYVYRFEILRNKIIREKLEYYDAGVRRNTLFDRYEQEFRNISKQWNKDANGKIEQALNFTKPQHLFLSVLISQDDIPRIDQIENWFKGNVILTGNYASDLIYPAKIYSDLKYRKIILAFIEKADLGFKSVFDKIAKAEEKGNIPALTHILYGMEKDDFTLYTIHKVFDENYHFDRELKFELSKHESSGSIKYFIIACYLTFAILEGQLVWIDELDSSLHTVLLTQLLQIFHNPKNNNRGCQLIFTTHNTVMLNRQLRRDQMLKIKKNIHDESFIEPFHTPDKPIRINKSIEQEYRDGKLDKDSDVDMGFQTRLFVDEDSDD